MNLSSKIYIAGHRGLAGSAIVRELQRQGYTNLAMRTHVQEMDAGLYDADLGSGLFKKRIGRPGEGKRGGFRTLVATNKGDRWIFVFGFPKNERSNIDKDEQEADAAIHWLPRSAREGETGFLAPFAFNLNLEPCSTFDRMQFPLRIVRKSI